MAQDEAAISSDGALEGYKNHTFNKYENYMSGYETAKEIPKGKLAKALALPILIAITCGLFIVNTSKGQKKNESWSWGSSSSSDSQAQAQPKDKKSTTMERNILDTRVSVLVNPSNQPCEDRFNCAQLKNLDGYYSAVFDGHGGWQVSELAMRRLHIILDEQLAKVGSNA